MRMWTVVLVIATAAPVAAQAQLPDGPGKEVTERLCGKCHEAQRAASVRLTREGWEGEVAKMVDLGMDGTDEDIKQALDYLSEHFKGEAPKPLNLNSATSV